MEREEVIIIGGGPAGMTAAIHLAKNGIKTTVFEKETFPRHKVCGEYLSKEILPYFGELDVNLNDLKPKDITRMRYSSLNGRTLSTELPLGGLGVSRYGLDDLLYRTAVRSGVIVKEEKVSAVDFSDDHFIVNTSENTYKSRFVLGAYGKRDLLDKQLGRSFFQKPAPWVGIKSHYEKNDFPDDLVELHNFKGGYCGLSKTETGAVNVCYLATYKSFRKMKDPELFREKVLRKNPFLDEFFSEAKEIFEKPMSIAQISFRRKESVENHMLMIGDTAGLIHPLCGNGMAMAIQSARIASEVILKQIQQKSPIREMMEKEYEQRWQKEFNRRLTAGRYLQKVLLNDTLSNLSQKALLKMPFLLPKIIEQTHGKPQKFQQ
ncbi:NAD(P)/FAD-dependent oxidoreductase [Salinimicrobium catena]|uniref:NAD(P)/FAD-dependent oxidoreductase n=1 Tax=Salinimicrobium catena TaxID=390640 RepID=UPI000B86BD81|nr:NAD(P)/FAD-dependent oxidoreductase [Salinimicrobium catena]